VNQIVGYIISNGSVGIEINGNNKPVVTSINNCSIFEQMEIANNILDTLPDKIKDETLKVVKAIGTTREVTNRVDKWREKAREIEVMSKEAIRRSNELKHELSRVDLELENVKHEIEMSKNKDMHKGWVLYAKQRELLRNRREIKDEFSVLQIMLGVTMNNIAKNGSSVEKAISKMEKRKYVYR